MAATVPVGAARHPCRSSNPEFVVLVERDRGPRATKEDKMRKLVLATSITVDGFMGRPDGSLD
jgi:hypothetical protein